MVEFSAAAVYVNCAIALKAFANATPLKRKAINVPISNIGIGLCCDNIFTKHNG